LPTVHKTAVVDKKARLAKDVTVGPFSVIESNVEIGEGSKIASHCLIADGARIGKNCQIHHGTVVATLPQDLKFSGETTLMEIGDNTVIREFCDLNRGTLQRGKSRVGSHCFLMAYTHVAHDCLLGDHVIMANGVQLAGHVTIEDWVIIGGLVAVHQFCTVGQHAFLGGGFRTVQDVPPYILAAGEPLAYKGLNVVGLTRRGFPKETIAALRKCYRIIYRSKLNTSQAIEKIRSEMDMTPEITVVMNFIEKSERGIIR
jgi:UDP-N-acetylglucosamine acyltransferase